MQRKSNWKLNLLAGALSLGAFAAFTVPAPAQINIIIGSTPPPVRYERRPPPPGDGYAWIDGYWAVDRGRYVWVPGRWDRPPYAGAYWSHPHYDRYPDGWHYHSGHWDREDHGDHRDDHQDDRHDNRKDNHRDNRQDNRQDNEH